MTQPRDRHGHFATTRPWQARLQIVVALFCVASFAGNLAWLMTPEEPAGPKITTAPEWVVVPAHVAPSIAQLDEGARMVCAPDPAVAALQATIDRLLAQPAVTVPAPPSQFVPIPLYVPQKPLHCPGPSDAQCLNVLERDGVR